MELPVNTIKQHQRNSFKTFPQPAITCSKLAIETLEQGVKYVQSKQ